MRAMCVIVGDVVEEGKPERNGGVLCLGGALRVLHRDGLGHPVDVIEGALRKALGENVPRLP